MSPYTALISIPESVKWRGSSGPTIGAIVRCSSAVAMSRRLEQLRRPDAQLIAPLIRSWEAGIASAWIPHRVRICRY